MEITLDITDDEYNTLLNAITNHVSDLVTRAELYSKLEDAKKQYESHTNKSVFQFNDTKTLEKIQSTVTEYYREWKLDKEIDRWLDSFR